MTQHLFLFQIGPVQAFIAQARRTQDLLVGSKMLSWLARSGWEVAHESAGFQAIFPTQASDDAPHKFAFISDADPNDLAESIHVAIQKAWGNDFAEPVYNYLEANLGKGDWQTVFERQAIPNWIEFYWVAVPLSADYAASYRALNATFNQRKQVRHFIQIEENGTKCTMTGSQSALPIDWKTLAKKLPNGNVIIRDNEKLGTIALIKRLVPHIQDVPPRFRTLIDGFKSIDTIAANDPLVTEGSFLGKDTRGYIAILHMDGDRMGAALNTLKSPDEHQEFSKALADFSKGVKKIIKDYGGQTGSLVYAGGDDVLALLPLDFVLSCADAIRKEFHSAMKAFTFDLNGKRQSPTMSAGIAITPTDLPLDRAIEFARKAEEVAKDEYGRDAVAFTEAHGSQERVAGAKWSDVITLMTDAQAFFRNRELSSKIAYDLQDIAHDMGGDNPKNIHLTLARQSELKRLLTRRMGEKANKDQKESILGSFAERITHLAETLTWTDASNWLILARFLAHQGKREGIVQE